MTAHVLVIGDVMLDEYVTGSVSRVSPEAPVPVVTAEGRHDHLGGAANVARQVVALGGRATLVGVVGDDDEGASVLRHCDAAGVDRRGVAVDAARPTTTKQRVMAGRQHVVRIDREDTRPVDAPLAELLVDVIDAALEGEERPDAVVVSDYAKGVVTDDVLRVAVGGARRRGIPVLVDPKDVDLTRYRGASVLKANAAEFAAAVGERAGSASVATTPAEGDRLLDRWDVDHLIVTLGADGMVVVGRGAVREIPAAARDVYDVSGAGDTVIATMALLMAAGSGVGDAAAVATVAAGLAVEQPGVGLVTRAELDAATTRTGAAKVMPADVLAERRRWWRTEGRRIVFTNGCFDLFHAGHAKLLQEAAAKGDVLVVAVDDDRSVRQLKGDGRPIIDERERMAIIAALSCVDAVVPFHSAELASLIETVDPDVLVKGADYSAADVVGAEWVRSRGGTVELVPLVGDLSTTALVGRIRGG